MAYTTISTDSLGTGVGFHRPEVPVFEPLTPTDPAIKAMTDLKKVSARTIFPKESIETANQKMIQNRIRMLFVVNISDEVIGLITANDILGEKPVRIAQQDQKKHSDITVQDIMTPVDQIDCFQIKDVSTARVGDIVETLKSKKRQHALVVDYQGFSNKRTIRGIFSLNQIARQLGIQVRSYAVGDTLAEIARVLQA
ncbi:MAG: CBS domain-containing protein [Leptonema illini]|jgi:CBS domain containing-hemolysin-like protein|uniref:CBS domain containing protein n=2 Tax=Leptonema illini TaxID=183 RepID=H2CDF2_9LEPT|nr:CBS domain-containing protein [Leptonema illini]EHQ06485.1 CBS domain containing protein [Leptonema illini DSM 21528]KAB2934794.1 MAG: CBS domain-containing protein [Leptonema illini]PKL32488.1 MAG: CBS domain-containing protein [Spirochaetae bacterium HGW-Spirochaetae-10]